MITTDKMKLLMSGLIMYTKKTSKILTAEVIDELYADLQKHQGKEGRLGNLYMDSLLEATIPKELFDEAGKKSTDPQWIHDYNFMLDAYTHLEILKFSDDEIFKVLSDDDTAMLQEVNSIWDPMRLFSIEVSKLMKHRLFNEHEKENNHLYRHATGDYTAVMFYEALNAIFRDFNRLLYIQVITREIALRYFPREAIIQLYLHARLGLVMGQDYYHGSYEEDKYLRKLAEFHADNANRIYLQVDYGLKHLNFSGEQTLNFLQNNTNTTDIQALHKKVFLMPKALDEVSKLVLGPAALTLEQAKTQVLNATEGLSQKDFDALLSPPVLLGLTYKPDLSLSSMLSSITSATSTPSSVPTSLPAVEMVLSPVVNQGGAWPRLETLGIRHQPQTQNTNNLQMILIAGIPLALCCLFLCSNFRRLTTTSSIMVNSARRRVLGFLGKPKEHVEDMQKEHAPLVIKTLKGKFGTM